MQFLAVEVLSCCVFCELSEKSSFCELSESEYSQQWILYQTCTGPDVTIIG